VSTDFELAVSLAVAQNDISQQIFVGNQLKERTVNDEPQLEELKSDVKKWVNYCITLINNKLFKNGEGLSAKIKSTSNRVIGVIYGQESTRYEAEFQYQRINRCLTELESIYQTLEFYVVPDGQTQMTQVEVDGKIPESKSKVFIVHGHDDGLRETVARFLETLGLKAIILHEQANAGNTIMEKIEKHSDVHYAVVLLTGDDKGGMNNEDDAILKLRARQNVIFEFGYFIGKLSRENVCALYKSGVELPSDLYGILYLPLENEAWKNKLIQELKKAGLDVNVEGLFNS
jgi:predicted nucleotide-binding protein